MDPSTSLLTCGRSQNLNNYLTRSYLSRRKFNIACSDFKASCHKASVFLKRLDLSEVKHGPIHVLNEAATGPTLNGLSTSLLPPYTLRHMQNTSYEICASRFVLVILL